MYQFKNSFRDIVFLPSGLNVMFKTAGWRHIPLSASRTFPFIKGVFF